MARPIVAIVGRPNVGKSTLFNRILGWRKAIVDPQSGLTRDRLYGIAEWSGREFTVVDTAGLDLDNAQDESRAAIEAQTKVAIDQAHVIVLLLDVRQGLTPVDREIATLLRRSGRKVLIAANKADSPSERGFAHEMLELGFDSPHLISAQHGIGVGDFLDYEELVAASDPDAWRDPGLDEREAAAMCYTSGTTGRPKGVLYSHRSTMLHMLGVGASNPLGLGISESDTLLPVVPMFHANAWGYPYLCAMQGVKQVFPGPYLDAESLLEDFVQEGVTWTAGVPTIWMGILRALDAEPDRWDLSRMKGMLVGGAAAPRSLIAGFRRHGLSVCHGWGMTETSPVATAAGLPGELAQADEETQLDLLATQGLPLPLVELRARGFDGALIPWDGEAMGELEIRGPWVAAAYYGGEDAGRWTEDGWFRTGDIVSLLPHGHVQIKDRSKDVIKSGGEWISSVELENALMAHPAVAEAAVIAVPDEKWDERPLAVVVVTEGHSVTGEELNALLAPDFVRWWLPDRYAFVEEIPKTSVGKFRKTALREQFAPQPEHA